MTSPHEKAISRDLGRTFPQHEFFHKESGQQALMEVVKAYSNFDPEVGYSQSIGFIAAVLLMNVCHAFDSFLRSVKLSSF